MFLPTKEQGSPSSPVEPGTKSRRIRSGEEHGDRVLGGCVVTTVGERFSSAIIPTCRVAHQEVEAAQVGKRHVDLKRRGQFEV